MVVDLGDLSVSYCEISGLVAEAVLHDLKVNFFTFDNFPEIIIDADQDKVYVCLEAHNLKTQPVAISKVNMKKLIKNFRNDKKMDLNFFQTIQKMVVELEGLYSELKAK